jgi:hypothetical protein
VKVLARNRDQFTFATIIWISLRPPASSSRRRAARVDAAYREWSRNRGDVDRLQELHVAVDQCLSDRLTSVD